MTTGKTLQLLHNSVCNVITSDSGVSQITADFCLFFDACIIHLCTYIMPTAQGSTVRLRIPQVRAGPLPLNGRLPLLGAVVAVFSSALHYTTLAKRVYRVVGYDSGATPWVRERPRYEHYWVRLCGQPASRR